MHIIVRGNCLMENHVHLLIEDRNGSVPIFIQKMSMRTVPIGIDILTLPLGEALYLS